MLEPVRHLLSTKRIVLASTSPRRRDILNMIGLKYEVVPSLYEEDLNVLDYDDPSDFVMDTATKKVEEVANRLKTGPNPPHLIIGADTMVVIDKKILGKPTDKQNAFDMLSTLSGRAHFVYTGVVLITETKTVKFFEQTKVILSRLDPDIINAYIGTGEPMDKAGSYGIQGIGGTLAEKIDGDFYNVIGLPLNGLCKKIKELCEEGKI